MDIPGLSTAYAILRRNIDRKNDILQQRKDLAKELLENCRLWSELLLSTFDEAVARWAVDGHEAAEREITKQQDDFIKLNYWSLDKDSPILVFLREDERFQPFANSCLSFYMSALSIKRIVYGAIKDEAEREFIALETEITVMVKLWRAEVERMLRDVNLSYMRIMVLVPK